MRDRKHSHATTFLRQALFPIRKPYVDQTVSIHCHLTRMNDWLKKGKSTSGKRSQQPGKLNGVLTTYDKCRKELCNLDIIVCAIGISFVMILNGCRWMSRSVWTYGPRNSGVVDSWVHNFLVIDGQNDLCPLINLKTLKGAQSTRTFTDPQPKVIHCTHSRMWNYQLESMQDRTCEDVWVTYLTHL